MLNTPPPRSLQTQYDGSSYQAGKEGVTGLEWAYNWVENTAKLAFRFDAGEDGIFGVNGTVHHNVAIGALNGWQIKGFTHTIANNLGFGSVQLSGEGAAEDADGGGGGGGAVEARTDFTVPRCYPCGPDVYFTCNNDTNVLNNGGYISAEGKTYAEPSWLTPPNPYMRNNFNSYTEAASVETLLRDADNHDFRPRVRCTAPHDSHTHPPKPTVSGH